MINESFASAAGNDGTVTIQGDNVTIDRNVPARPGIDGPDIIANEGRRGEGPL
jgi:hypothetical protein